MIRLTRRGFVAGATGGLSAGLLPATAEDPAPSAASLARPAAAPLDASGLAVVDADNAPVPLSRFAGALLVVNFWAPWCLPCRREMPALARLARRLAGTDVAVLPVAFDWRGATGVARFYRETGIDNLPIYLGDGDNLLATLGIERLPTTVVLDRRARTLATVAGEARWDDDATRDWLAGLAAHTG